MYKIMIGAISNYVQEQAAKDEAFKSALNLEWKSAGRMLKYIFGKARSMAIKQNGIASCCLPDEVVYAMVREYYFLDDKEEVEKEREAKRIEQEKKEKEKKKEAEYRNKAIELLSKDEDWENLSDEEKESKIKVKISSLKSAAKRKSTKSDKKKAEKAKSEKEETSVESKASELIVLSFRCNRKQ